MDLRDLAFDPTLVDAFHELLELPDETGTEKLAHHAPSRAYLRDKKAMTATPADVLEYPDSYVFILDMPGLKPDQVKVQVEDGNVLVVSGERKREKVGNKDVHVKYLKMERRLGKYLKRFPLPDMADIDKISAEYKDGVLTATVGKKPPPEPKKPKTVEVQVG